MKKILNPFVFLFGLLLPLHGGITVFFPEPFRWWKEICLVFLGLFWIYAEWEKNRTEREKYFSNWSVSEISALLFIFWAIVLTTFSTEIFYATQAARYLILAPTTWLILTRLRLKKSTLYKFFHGIAFGGLISIGFGLWMNFGNGFETVGEYFSETISSWVPGQTIPLWHEINGVARLQGLSSGPIEFSHILVIVFGLNLWLNSKKIPRIFFLLVLILSIYLSASRSAMLGVLVISGHWIWNTYEIQIKKFSLRRQGFGRHARKLLLLFGVLLMTGIFVFNQFDKIWERAGTSDHITRPIEVFQHGIKSPIMGQIGSVGPAARAKNLAINDNDSALIAENVFVDIFAQLGLTGLAFFLAWIIAIYTTFPQKFRGIFWTMVLTLNLATIFDMTPVSLTFGITLALLCSSNIGTSDAIKS